MKDERLEAYRVVCRSADGDAVEFGIGLKSVKNSENVCAHCPARHTCRSKTKGTLRLKFYEDLRRNVKRRLPMEVGFSRR